MEQNKDLNQSDIPLAKRIYINNSNSIFLKKLLIFSPILCLLFSLFTFRLIKNIETAITESNLGINPQTDGNIIRLPIPKLSEERRHELTKIASQYAENFKISIRNIRRDFIEVKKREKKDSNLSEDELKKFLSDAQIYTDKYIVNIDKISSLGLEQVDAQILKEKGLIRSALKPVKILGNGELNKKIDITATVFSKSAKQKIEEAGGTAIEL